MTRTIILSPKSTNHVLDAVTHVLSKGGLVIFPSDTVYGLLVDGTNKAAVKKLIEFKNRAPGKAISVFVSDLDSCKNHVSINQKQSAILSKLLPGPFTMVLPSKHTVQKLLESENGTLGVRVPDYQPILQLTSSFGKPITATSANLGGKSPHYSIDSFLHQIPQLKKDLVDLIVDAGKLPRNKPSTVLDLTESTVKTLRSGDIVFEKSTVQISHSAQETQKIGRTLIQSLSEKYGQKPLVVILKGDLGAGKTEMTRGIANYYGIEKIISPTFVVYYEYVIQKIQNSKFKIQNSNIFIHVDLYNIQEETEFDHLGLSEYLNPGNVMVVEWGEKLGKMYAEFQKKAVVVFVEIEYDGENGRKIRI